MGMREFQARQRALQQINDSTADATAQQTAVEQQGGDYAVLEIALINDVNAVRAFPTLEQRKAYKQERFLPKWIPFVEEYLKKGNVYQNDYFLYCIIYLFDVGDFDKALAWADIASAQNQSMPKGFDSTLPAFVARQIYQWADKTAAAGQSVEPYFSQVFEKIATQWQLHEHQQAAWLKMAAALLLRNADGQIKAAGIDDPDTLALAVQLCNRAFWLNSKIGVKNLIERCVMRLAALAKQGKNPKTALPQPSGLSLENTAIDLDRVIEKLTAGRLQGENTAAETAADNNTAGAADV